MSISFDEPPKVLELGAGLFNFFHTKQFTMKKNYELTGMSCGGCVNTVTQALMRVPGVEKADVQLNPQCAVITLNQSVDVKDLQAGISKAGHYTIKEVGEN